MSSGWYLFLFLFIFGVTAQGVNQMGIWDTNYSEQGYTIDTGTVQTSIETVREQPITGLFTLEMLASFFTVIGSGILAVISLPALFYMMGWPVDVVSTAFIQIVQLPATLTFFVWIFELVTGRAVG